MKKRIPTLAATAAVLFAFGAAGAEPPKKTPELVAKGKASFETNCATCHGDRGLGDGPAGAALDPKPRNLVKDAFKNGTKPTQVFSTLTKGIDGTTMVSFAHLPPDELWALTYYTLDLRSAKPAKAKK
jgi:mono/diheme cytochrome c family protein